MHTFSNNEKYRATLRFGRVADPNEKTKEIYQLVGGYPEPVAFLGIDGITYKKATMSQKIKKFSNFVEFIENLH